MRLDERVDDGGLDLREPVLEEERAERGLEQRREDVAVLREPLELLGLEAVVVLHRAARPRSSSRATTAQLARETTCERIFASRPSENSG